MDPNPTSDPLALLAGYDLTPWQRAMAEAFIRSPGRRFQIGTGRAAGKVTALRIASELTARGGGHPVHLIGRSGVVTCLTWQPGIRAYLYADHHLGLRPGSHVARADRLVVLHVADGEATRCGEPLGDGAPWQLATRLPGDAICLRCHGHDPEPALF